jgi:hypothetical protein
MFIRFSVSSESGVSFSSPVSISVRCNAFDVCRLSRPVANALATADRAAGGCELDSDGDPGVICEGELGDYGESGDGGDFVSSLGVSSKDLSPFSSIYSSYPSATITMKMFKITQINRTINV